MATTQLTSLEVAYTYLATESSQSPRRSMPTEDLARWLGPEEVAGVVDRVYAGRAARELIQKTTEQLESLRMFCAMVFDSYLPRTMQTEKLGEIFEKTYHWLDPETKIAMYKKWLAELPYHEFTDLTTMTISPIEKNSPILAMPSEIARFSYVKKLSFSTCLLSIPPALKRLSSLEILDLRRYSGSSQDLENFKETCLELPHLEKIVFSHTFRLQPAFTEMLHRDFPRIKVEFKYEHETIF